MEGANLRRRVPRPVSGGHGDLRDGRTQSSGIINCNRLTLGNAGGPNPTSTTVDGSSTPTSPTCTATGRPAEPDTDGAPDANRRARPARGCPSPTHTQGAPTATRTQPPLRPTRTPRIVPATATSRPTRTAIRFPPNPHAVQPSDAHAGQRRADPHPGGNRCRRDPPDRSPDPYVHRGARDPHADSEPVNAHGGTDLDVASHPHADRSAGRPERRGEVWSGDPFDPHGLHASCSLRRTVDLVSITMVVENQTGANVTGLTGGSLVLAPEGGSLFFDRTGPSPVSYALLNEDFDATFQWTGRLNGGGTMGFAASVNGDWAERRGRRHGSQSTAVSPWRNPRSSMRPGSAGTCTITTRGLRWNQLGSTQRYGRRSDRHRTVVHHLDLDRERAGARPARTRTAQRAQPARRPGEGLLLARQHPRAW